LQNRYREYSAKSSLVGAIRDIATRHFRNDSSEKNVKRRFTTRINDPLFLYGYLLLKFHVKSFRFFFVSYREEYYNPGSYIAEFPRHAR